MVTVETSTHKPFVFVDGDVVPDHKLYAIASDDPWVLGVLSSRCHLVWALAAGGRNGVGDDPTWTNTTCFLPFPFPARSPSDVNVSKYAQEIDAHRKTRQVEHPSLTITAMYNVLDKLRASEPLTAKEKTIHEQGLVSVLQKLHDDLDVAVFDAYGWPYDLTDEQILERLVALNHERADEERRGVVRWLRPDFQNPDAKQPTQAALVGTEAEEEEAASVVTTVPPWPKKLADQIARVRDVVTKSSDEWSVENVASGFKGAKRKDAEDVLDALAALGLLVSYELPEGKRWRASRFVG